MGKNEVAQHNGTNNSTGNESHEFARDDKMITLSGSDDDQLSVQTQAEEKGHTEVGRRYPQREHRTLDDFLSMHCTELVLPMIRCQQKH